MNQLCAAELELHKTPGKMRLSVFSKAGKRKKKFQGRHSSSSTEVISLYHQVSVRNHLLLMSSYLVYGGEFTVMNFRYILGHGFLILCLSKLSRGIFEQSVGR